MGRKMPIAICTNCGRTTNSSTSNYWLDTEVDGKTPKEMWVATRCYLAFVDELWVRGCGYDGICLMQKKLLEHLLMNEGV